MQKAITLISKVAMIAVAVVLILIYIGGDVSNTEDHNKETDAYKDSLEIARIDINFRDSMLKVMDIRIDALTYSIDSLDSVKAKIVYKYKKQKDEILNDSDSATIEWFNSTYAK